MISKQGDSIISPALSRERVKYSRPNLILLLERCFHATSCFHLSRYIYFLILSDGWIPFYNLVTYIYTRSATLVVYVSCLLFEFVCFFEFLVLFRHFLIDFVPLSEFVYCCTLLHISCVLCNAFSLNFLIYCGNWENGANVW